MSLLRSAVVAALGTLMTLLVLPAQAAALDIAPEVERCLAGSNKLSVVLMVDGSASLQDFDPNDERVSGVKAVLAALSRAAEEDSSDQRVEVEVLLASFYGETKPRPVDTVGGSGWRKLDSSSLKSILDKAQEYEDKNTGRDTDYALALDNAKKLLAQRAVERSEQGGEAPPCNLIVFFTDGEYSVTDRDEPDSKLPLRVPYAPSLDLSRPDAGKEAMRLGKKFLCRKGGLVDQLNSQNIVLLTVALAKGGAGIDTTLVESISGQRGGCGVKPSLADYVEGVTGAKLLFDFSDSLTGTRPKRKKLPPCAGGDCRGGGRNFTTLKGEKGFKLLATTGSSEEGIRFVDPSGEFIEIEAGDSSGFEASGVSFEPLWLSDTTIDLVAEFDTESTEWVGDWNVALNTSRRGLRGNLHSLSFQADLKPVQSGGRTLFRGQENQVSFRLESADGDPLDPDDPSDVLQLLTPRAELSGGNEGSKALDIEGPDSNLELTANVKIPPTETSNEVQIDLTLDFSGAGGRDIDPIRRSFPYRAKLPDSLGYPEIETAALSLPSITGVGDSTGTVEVRGTAGKGGCVWLGAVEVVNAPGGSRPVKVSTEPAARNEGQCIKVAEGETKQIEVTVAPKGEANGTVDLNLGFGLLSGIESVTKVESSTVGVTLPVAKEPNVPARVLILVLLTLLGALLPVLLLHLLNRAGARFTAPQGLLYLQESVELGSGQAALSGDTENAGAMLEADHSSFNLVKASGVEKQVREHRVGSLKLRTIASFSRSPQVFTLIPGPIGVVESSEGRPVIAGAQMSLREWGGYRWHEIPLDVPGTWVFEVHEVGESLDDDDPFTNSDSAGRRVKGVLTLFTRYGGDPDQGERLLETALRKLGDFDWSRIPTTRLEEQGSTSGEPVQRDSDLIDDGFDPEESTSSGDDVLGEGWD